ncbi:unnamed protein product [Gongylonema pulchrum]|uniref:Calcium uniporter protein n=1 Tax=Gongylonema pulchrum TaxID=637853 RepID=A0A183EFF2_9BILA|nr:unnamed protein product [Gongylonema pulchrum]
MWYHNGLPALDVPLPSRQEMCQFTLRPVNDTVAQFCQNIRNEDKGIEIVRLYAQNDNRIAGSTSVEHLLLQGNFKLRVNDVIYTVDVPSFPTIESNSKMGSDRLRKFDDLKSAVASLHAVMNVDEFKAFRERKLMERFETVQAELKPLSEVRFTKARIDAECEKQAQRTLWYTLGLMGLQAGFFARLTWWEYSWDIMEPVTYFATYATLMASFAYYMYTNQSYDYGDHKRRRRNILFHRKATEYNFDISRFNELQNLARSINHDLTRLRDPLYQHLPAARLASLLNEDPRKSSGGNPVEEVSSC